MMSSRPFSVKWMIISMVIFIAVELFLGGFLAPLIAGKVLSIQTNFLLRGVINLISFFVGGFIVGLISPGLRIDEPAAGAFLSVAVMMLLALFTPYTFIHFSAFKMLIGGAIAFFLALSGARLGEKVAGNRLP